MVGIRFILGQVADDDLLPTGEPAMIVFYVMQTPQGNLFKVPIMEVGRG